MLDQGGSAPQYACFSHSLYQSGGAQSKGCVRSSVLLSWPYLVLELGDLSLTGRVVLDVVQHDLSIGQQSFGSLQVFLQTLLSLYVTTSHL